MTYYLKLTLITHFYVNLNKNEIIYQIFDEKPILKLEQKKWEIRP